ncbi:MAG: hypothetical protein R3B06_21735 [Kofleriaceae bacterium]
MTAHLRAFFTATIAKALEVGVATPADVVAHATPEVLAQHLPRPEWTKLLAACLGAARTDPALVVDTVTVPVLCEHVPPTILWACVAKLANRALGRGLVAPPPAVAVMTPVAAAVPVVASAPVAAPAAVAAPAPVAASSSGPVAAPARAGTSDERTADAGRGAPSRGSTVDVPRVARIPEPAPLGDPPSAPRAGSRTGLGARRPQAAAPVPPPSRAPEPRTSRASTATDFEVEADLGGWKKDLEQVDDDQLIDWSQSEETVTSGERLDRKR